jgi:hypothetical protein
LLSNARFPGFFNDIKLIHKPGQPLGIEAISRIIHIAPSESCALRQLANPNYLLDFIPTGWYYFDQEQDHGTQTEPADPFQPA